MLVLWMVHAAVAGVVPGGVTDLSAADVLVTDAARSGFGYAMHSADLNEDGTLDLVVGAWATHTTYIFMGPLDPTLDTADADYVVTDPSGGELGFSITTGNFVGGSALDLAIGAVNHNYPFVSGGGEGAVYIFEGPFNDQTYPEREVDTQVAATFIENRLNSTLQADNFGWSLAAGDYNADGQDDLAVASIGASNGLGAVVVFTDFSSAMLTHVSGDRLLNTAAGLTGLGLATGDFDGDGIDDLVIGAPSAKVSQAGTTRAAVGAVHVVYGRSSWGPLDLAAASPFVWRVVGDRTGENLGWSVATGDVDLDGRDEILAGAPGLQCDGTASECLGATNIGRTFLLESPAGTRVSGTFVASQESTRTIDGLPAEGFGVSVAIGEYLGPVVRFVQSTLEMIVGTTDSGAWVDSLDTVPGQVSMPAHDCGLPEFDPEHPSIVGVRPEGVRCQLGTVVSPALRPNTRVESGAAPGQADASRVFNLGDVDDDGIEDVGYSGQGHVLPDYRVTVSGRVHVLNGSGVKP